MVNLRCPVCAGALEKRAGAYLCPKNHSFDIAKSGYVNLLLNSSQGHHGDDKLMVRARRDFLDKGYYDRFIAAVADAAAEFTPPEATVLDAGCGEGIYSLAVLRAYPLREHLWELKVLIYDTPRDNPPTPLTTEGFTLVETREVRDIIHLSCNEDILSLFCMTPYYYKTGAKDQQKAERAQELSVKLAFGLAIYQKD